ncbi:MAG: hypothetical protein E7242_07745 [Lachnospiraceae bacterium]|nr:hypothetical protein [Lachnospiraceae bacterium]
MKKIITLILASFTVFGLLTGCNSGLSNHKVGETVETNIFNITLNDAKFSDSILIGHINWLGLGDKDVIDICSEKDEFFTATDEPLVNESGASLADIKGFGYGFGPEKNNTEDTYLWYDIEFQYTGKEQDITGVTKLAPKVYYKDYTFDTNYVSMFRTKTDGNISDWGYFDSDLDGSITAEQFKLNSLLWSGGQMEPLTQKTYEVRGIIRIPKTAAEDKDEKIILSIYDANFIVN